MTLTPDDEIFAEAAPRLERLAVNFAQRYSALPTANLFVACGLTLIRENYGSAVARRYFEELANSIPDDRLQ